MNLLKHYILQVFSVESIPHQDWMDREWVEVLMMVDCYGIREKRKYINTREEFERDMQRGYFMW